MNLSRRKQTSSKRISNSAKRTNVSELSSGGTRDRIHHRARTSQTKSRRPRPMRTGTTNSHVLTVGHRVESPDTTLSGEPHLTQIEKSTLPVTAVRSVAKGSTSRRASAPDSSRNSRIQPPEVTQYNRHHYECYYSCGAETVASHPDCPDEGQFGVNVIARRSFQIRSPPPLPEDRRPLRATA